MKSGQKGPKPKILVPQAKQHATGVIIDAELPLSFLPHVNTVTKVDLYHMRNIAKVLPFLSSGDRYVC